MALKMMHPLKKVKVPTLTLVSDNSNFLWFCEYDQEKLHAALLFYLVWSRKYGTLAEAIFPVHIVKMELSLTCLPDNI
jgi:hypothetical protein